MHHIEYYINRYFLMLRQFQSFLIHFPYNKLVDIKIYIEYQWSGKLDIKKTVYVACVKYG